MWYCLFLDDTLVHVTKCSPYTGTPQLRVFNRNGVDIKYNRVVDESEMTHEQAVKAAFYLTARHNRLYLPTTNENKFGVVQAPALGDKVSYAFNGDSYPCGEIVKISDKLQVTTSTGEKFRRVKETGGWKRTGGTWYMVYGHESKLNPSF